MFVMTYLRINILLEAHHLIEIEDSLQVQPNISDLWKLETIGIKPLEEKRDDKEVMADFQSTVMRKDNRYQLAWSWKEKKLFYLKIQSYALGDSSHCTRDSKKSRATTET